MKQGSIPFPDERAPELPLAVPLADVAMLARGAAKNAAGQRASSGFVLSDVSDDHREWSKERVRVFRSIRGAGGRGATCHEVERSESMLHQTASARITELHGLGAIVASGEYRRTPSGRKAIVWKVVAGG